MIHKLIHLTHPSLWNKEGTNCMPLEWGLGTLLQEVRLRRRAYRDVGKEIRKPAMIMLGSLIEMIIHLKFSRRNQWVESIYIEDINWLEFVDTEKIRELRQPKGRRNYLDLKGSQQLYVTRTLGYGVSDTTHSLVSGLIFWKLEHEDSFLFLDIA